jgi:hypothetical protein
VFILVLVFSLLWNDRESTLQERYPDMRGLDLQAMEVRERAQQAADMIQVVSPREWERITSPLTLSWFVKKEWMTEEGFPIELRENDGDIMTTVMARKMEESWSGDYVSFSAIVDFVAWAVNTPAKIVFKNSNPWNDPNLSLEYWLWVSF